MLSDYYDCLAGELGWELYVKMANLSKLYAALFSVGKHFDLGDFGTYAMNSLRLEKGFRAWGSEVISKDIKNLE